MAELVINIPDEVVEIAKELYDFALDMDKACAELAERLSARAHYINGLTHYKPLE